MGPVASFQARPMGNEGCPPPDREPILWGREVFDGRCNPANTVSAGTQNT
ncbi:hypothetical protein HMPREF9440_01127 [Sutterella parvirubra YIT 11816]|uniref:Uncharacterized protein n=1 Tax=Sutterella parvirubra YIT 11816 TaxID=762967 RepID=H3KEG3_9BURK|nr:hypothetical protein HMPREF9440_01127 [Sutterella parvirubra YIT 11816]